MRRFIPNIWVKNIPFIGEKPIIVPIIQEEGGSILGPKSDEEIKAMDKYYDEMIKSRPKNIKVIDMNKN